MFSYFQKRHDGAAYSSSKTEDARRAALAHLETVLFSWLDGRERAYSVIWAVKEIKLLFGEAAENAEHLITCAMHCDHEDEQKRLGLVTKALDLLATARRGEDVRSI